MTPSATASAKAIETGPWDPRDSPGIPTPRERLGLFAYFCGWVKQIYSIVLLRHHLLYCSSVASLCEHFLTQMPLNFDTFQWKRMCQLPSIENLRTRLFHGDSLRLKPLRCAIFLAK